MRGCQDQVSWSRKGLIAFIADEKVFMTLPYCQNGHRWSMAPPVEVPLSTCPVHLSWSSVNYDLAIVDNLGRIQITAVNSEGHCINYIIGSFAADSRPRTSELDVVIGTYWLGVDKKMVMPTARDAPRPWEPLKTPGPFHPVRNRGALLAVNGNGMLRLLLQLPSLRYQEVDSVLSDISDVRKVAFCSAGDNLLVAVYTGSGQLTVFEVSINWQEEETSMKTWTVASIDRIPDPNIVSLAIIRPPFSTGDEFVLRVICEDASHSYRIKKRSLPLNSAFLQLSTTCESPPSIPEWSIESAGSVSGRPKVRGFYVLDLFCLTVYIDGTTSSESLVQSPSSLADSGLVYSPHDLQASEFCFSPTGCAFCFLTERGEPELSLVEQVSDTGQNLRDVTTCLATHYAFTVFNSIQSSDDVVAVSWKLAQEQKGKNSQLFTNLLVAETQRLLNVSFAAPMDSRHIDLAIIIPSPLQRWLAFRMVMGTFEGWRRNKSGLLALAVLNLQMAAVSATWTLKKVMVKQPAPHKAEIALRCFHISNMFGQVRWVSDLVVRISQELYVASVSPGPGNGVSTRTAAQAVLAEEPNVLSSLCFGSITRFLLKYALSGIRSLSYATRSIADGEAQLGLPAEECIAAQTKKRFDAILSAVPVSVEKFERVLKDLDTIVAQQFSKQRIGDSDRQAMDAEFVRNARCPSALLPLCDSLVQAFNTHVLSTEDVDLVRMYFYDTDWLNVDDLKPSFKVDGIRKRLLSDESSLRCNRCGMRSIKDSPKLQNIPHWTVLFQRQCLCGGTWIKNVAS